MTEQEQKKEKKKKRAIIILWSSFSFIVLLFIVLIILINKGLMGDMPTMGELENPNSALSSELYATDGTTLLGRYYVQDRSNCKFADISPNIINALIATEDARFYDHAGIDPIATIAIPFYAVFNKKRGSSTITQQLAKNLFERTSKSKFLLPLVKLKEWVLAIKLERNLTKNEILTLYLNTVPFSDNVYGITNASLTFYKKTPDKVTIEEAATLVGMLKANTQFNPRTHPKRATERRNTVLEQMYKYKSINSAQLAELKAKKILLDYHKIDYHTGLAPYFRYVVEQQLKQVLKELRKPDGREYDIYKDGLRITTTLDVKLQRYAEEAVQEHLTDWQKVFMSQNGYRDGTIWNKGKEIQNILNNAVKSSEHYQAFKGDNMTDEQAFKKMKEPVKMKIFAWNASHSKDTVMSPLDSIKYMKTTLQAGFMVMDHSTGEVKAWVGGIDHNYFQYDHVNINAKRQVGSTIKPLLYCLAIDNGFSPCDMVSTAPVEFEHKYGMDHPYDAGGSEFGNVTMKFAIANSINNAALYVLEKIGIEAFVDFAQKCGIKSRMDPFPSVALGVSDISLYEMMTAYTMFPNGGMNSQPFLISKIEDKNGMLIKNFSYVQKEIINPITAFKMVNMMRGVVNNGTGARIRGKYGIKSDVAGKTGTTNNQADAWFIGYTPQLLAGAWVGCDDREFRFRREDLGQGAASALPIWALFMRKVFADKTLNYNPTKSFTPPEGFVDCDADNPNILLEDTNKNPDGYLEKPAPGTMDYGQ